MIVIKIDDTGEGLDFNVFTPRMGNDGVLESVDVTDQYVAHQLEVTFEDRPQEGPLAGVFFAKKPTNKEESDGE